MRIVERDARQSFSILSTRMPCIINCVFPRCGFWWNWKRIMTENQLHAATFIHRFAFARKTLRRRANKTPDRILRVRARKIVLRFTVPGFHGKTSEKGMLMLLRRNRIREKVDGRKRESWKDQMVKMQNFTSSAIRMVRCSVGNEISNSRRKTCEFTYANSEENKLSLEYRCFQFS